MKLAPALFAISVAINVALVVAMARWPARDPSDPAHGQDARATEQGRSVQVQLGPRPSSVPSADATEDGRGPSKLWASLDREDLPAFVARLRGAGFPPGLIRAIVTAKVEARYRERLRPLLAAMEATPFWKTEPNNYFYGDARFREALSQANRDRSRELRELLGHEIFDQPDNDPTAAQRRLFGNLPRTKVDLILRIYEDYDEMASQIRNAPQGISLPEDREKLALLEREKRADLAGILTSAELADYDLRTSSITSRLRNAFTDINATDAEFRAIYDIHQRYNDALYPGGGNARVFTPEMMQQRDAAQQKVADEIRAALGGERYTDFARASHREFRSLVEFAQREDLPRDAIVRAFDVRDHAARESNRIFDDNALNTEQKRAALQSLAHSIRGQWTASLGPTVAKAHEQSTYWLSTLERGGAVTFGPDGNTRSSRRLPPPP